ncbi:MAG: S8 family serine peptidase [Oceanicoccus sp.]
MSTTARRISQLCTLMIITALAGCGGGGGGSSANAAPTASFTTAIDTSIDSLTVTFDGSRSVDGDGSIREFLWDYGDGSNGTGMTSSHRYSTAGSYSITLTTIDNNNASDTYVISIDLSVVVARATLSKDPNSASVGALLFDATASEINGTTSAVIVSYQWDFGDGSTADGPVVYHSYTAGRSFSATLTVTDSNGNRDSLTLPTTFSLSGVISAAGNTVVDIDVNDPSRQNKTLLGTDFQTNDETYNAQLLTNPVIVNGFSNATGTGEPPSGSSNFSVDTDRYDLYSAYLIKDQFVSLRVADFDPDNQSGNDLDLHLYDSDYNLVSYSDSITEYESIIIPADGQYFIRIYSYRGISKYILNVGNQSLASGASVFGNSATIITGEAIIKQSAEKAVNSVSNNSISRSKTVLPLLQGLSHQEKVRPALMKFDLNTSNTLAKNTRSITTRLAEKNSAIRQTLDHIKQLRLRDDVEYAEPNYKMTVQVVPNDPFYPLQWHYPRINLPQAWEITTGTPVSGTVIVAVVDNGIVLNHADLTNKLVGGYDFIRNTDTSQDGDGIDSDPSDPGDGNDVRPNSWHGTHVAGTIAADSNNNYGVAGVSWGAQIMPIRVLGKGGGSSYDVMQGIRYAAGLSNDSGTVPPKTADIINLSLGGQGYSQSSQELFTQLHDNGIIVIAAAGNESSSAPIYPAAYNDVISVSAVDLAGKLAPYSNFGDSIDVAAPGGDASIDLNGDGYSDGVLSTLFDDTDGIDSFVFLEGTSMATPHVAGISALMKSVYPDLTASQFYSSLQGGYLSNDIGTTGKDNLYGFGLIDALKSVQQAQLLLDGLVTGTIAATPSRIDFGGNFTSRNLTLSKVGEAPPNVASITNTMPWLSIDASGSDINGAGDYILQANRNGLADAAYSGAILFTLDDTTEVSIPISMLVQTGSDYAADAGFLYVLLLDADTFEFVYQIKVDVTDGEYAYTFDNVPYGEYVIIAGSDVDNDFVICGIGESCGNYPTNEQPLRITVDNNIDNLDFLASMVSGVISGANNQSITATGFKRKEIILSNKSISK